MTPLLANDPDHTRLHWQGWICSVTFHGVIGGCALALFSSLNMSVEPDQFSWNVVMVDVPEAQPKSEMPSETKPVLPNPRVTASQPAPARPMIETGQRAVQVVQSVPQVAQHEAATVNQTASVVAPVLPPSETSARVSPTATREAVAQEEQVVATHSATTQQPSTPVVTDSLVTHQDTEPIVPHAAVETTSEPTVQSQLPAVKQTVAPTAPAKADYGWLVKALLGRVEELKNYPQMARINHWEGKVILRAVIKDDGQVMMINVHESSGQLTLDNDAIETLRRASPLKLDHPLGKPQVAILMPISYALR